MNIGTVLFPFILSFDKKVAFYKNFKFLFPAILITGIFFLIWDQWFTDMNVWGFNSLHLTGYFIGDIPIEEVMFFVTVPYACLFIYECLIAYIGRSEVLEKTPGVKFLYSSVKDIVEAFVGEKKKFSKPVMVEMNGEGIYKIGFVTIKDLTKINMEGYSGVYFPKSYGFMGDLYLVDNKKIKPLDANPTMVFKMIVSGGVTGFEGPDA